MINSVSQSPAFGNQFVYVKGDMAKAKKALTEVFQNYKVSEVTKGRTPVMPGYSKFLIECDKWSNVERDLLSQVSKGTDAEGKVVREAMSTFVTNA